MFIVANGQDQGDPFSGICYLIYNADLTKIPIPRLGKWVLLFMDNVAIIVIGKDFVETHTKLHNIMNCVGGIFEWVSHPFPHLRLSSDLRSLSADILLSYYIALVS